MAGGSPRGRRLLRRRVQAGPTQPTVVESSPTRLRRSERSDSVEVAELIDGEFGFER
jgi:hypothetical protein